MANEYFDGMTSNGTTYEVVDQGARAGVSALQTALASLQSALDTLMGTDDITDEIDTYNEIKDFLDGFDVNDPNLSSQLALLNSQVNDLTTAIQNKANTSALNTAVANLQALINGKVEAVPGKGLSTNDYTNEDKAAVATIANKANSADVYTKSQTYSKGEVDTALGRKLGVNDVSAQTPSTPDGTFTIHVGETDYTINLNHTHENMAKLVMCEEADLPATLETDTIYCVVNDDQLPTEIETLYICGLEFAGGNATPKLTNPANGSTIDVGTNAGSGVTQTITIKGKNLTQALTVALSGTDAADFTVSENSITAANANTGTTLSITYNGTASSATATLTISSSEVSATCSLTADYDTYAGVQYDMSVNTSGAVVSNNGTCVSPLIELSGGSHYLEIYFGMTAAGMGLGGYDTNGDFVDLWTASADFRVVGLTSTVVKVMGTFDTASLDDCYIYDHTDGVFLFKGENVTAPYYNGFTFGKIMATETEVTDTWVCYSPIYALSGSGHTLQVKFGGTGRFCVPGYDENDNFIESWNATSNPRTFTVYETVYKVRGNFVLSKINECYIYDETDSVFIFKGYDVTSIS